MTIALHTGPMRQRAGLVARHIHLGLSLMPELHAFFGSTELANGDLALPHCYERSFIPKPFDAFARSWWLKMWRYRLLLDVAFKIELVQCHAIAGQQLH